MAKREKILMCWSGGKDSTLALHEVLQDERYEVAALLTTVTRDYGRISMHGVRKALLEEQARSLGLPLSQVLISKGADNREYEARMEEALRAYQREGVSAVCFGDIFLEDLRAYRERNLAALGLRGLFPLWKRDTAALMDRFVSLGFKAVVVCVDTRSLDASFAGKEIDANFRASLPTGVDPCGENGEYHSFVYEGPIYRRPIRLMRGETAVRDVHFCFHDLLPAHDAASLEDAKYVDA